MQTEAIKKSTLRVRALRERNRLIGKAYRLEANLKGDALSALNDLKTRTGFGNTELVEAAILLLKEAMDNGEILRSELG
jgi:hypothetical protein